jgi:hypothetical protein
VLAEAGHDIRRPLARRCAPAAQPARRGRPQCPRTRPSQPPLLHPPARQACAGASVRHGQPPAASQRGARGPAPSPLSSPPYATAPAWPVRVPPARPRAQVQRGSHVCPWRGLHMAGVPATRSRVPGVTSRASCVTPVCRRCHRRPCPQQPWRNLRGSLAVASCRARSTSSCIAASLSGRPPSSRGEHCLRVSKIVSSCLTFYIINYVLV